MCDWIFEAGAEERRDPAGSTLLQPRRGWAGRL